MSRRFSDDPINLIDRIPSRAQLSAAQPKQRAWGRAVLESGAACVRGLAEAMAQLRRLWRMVHAVSSEGRASGRASLASVKAVLFRAVEFAAHAKVQVVSGSRVAAVRFVEAYDRLAEWIANLDAAVPATLSAHAPSAGTPQGVMSPVQPEPQARPQFYELAELKASFISQQQELAHVSAQLQELKALVVSQQQVLMFLGKELDTAQHPSVTTVASAPARRTRVVRAKTGKEKKLPQKGASKPSLNL